MRLSTWLRWLGATSFAGGAVAFLVEGWSDTDPLIRAILWGIATLALTVCGLLAVKRWQDPVGARLAMGLAAASIPAHFAQVGASIWSHAVEETASLSTVVAVCAVVAALWLPLSFGIAALVRHRGKQLTTALFILGVPLLLPTREPDTIAAIAAGQGVLLLALEWFVWRKDSRLQSVEGIAVRALLVLPVAILLVRNGFYALSNAWIAACLALPGAFLVALPALSSWRGRLSAAVQSVGIAALGLAVFLLTPFSPVTSLLLTLLFALASRAVLGRSAFWMWAGVGSLALGAVWAFQVQDIAYLVLIAPVGALVALLGFQRHSLALLLSSAFCAAAGIVAQLSHLVTWPSQHGWLFAAVGGVLLLLLASVAENRRIAENQRGTGRRWSIQAFEHGEGGSQ